MARSPGGTTSPAACNVPGTSERRLHELQIGFRQCIATEADKVRRLIVANLEPIGIRVLQASPFEASAA
jgi:hypothetical protein